MQNVPGKNKDKISIQTSLFCLHRQPIFKTLISDLVGRQYIGSYSVHLRHKVNPFAFEVTEVKMYYTRIYCVIFRFHFL